MTDLDAPRPVLQSVTDGRLAGFGQAARNTAPAMVLIGVFVVVLIAEGVAGGVGGWGLSGQALAEGRWYTLGSHMVAHAGLAHMWMNSAALLALTAPVMTRLGGVWSVRAWVRYALLFGLSGLAGAALFVALHPHGTIPMVGASGAICGLWGAVARLGADGGIVALRSRPVWTQIKAFTKMNVALVLVLLIPIWLGAAHGLSLAWEAHLGGFLFGLLAMPRLAPILAPVPVPATA